MSWSRLSKDGTPRLEKSTVPGRAGVEAAEFDEPAPLPLMISFSNRFWGSWEGKGKKMAGVEAIGVKSTVCRWA